MITTLGVPLVPRVGPATQPPPTGPLIDSYGPPATDLRVSLPDRCNLRCSYCMPAEGLRWEAAEQLLQPDETIRLVRIGVARLGITKVRFTGGEPLLAKHLEEIVAATAALRPRPQLALTTNGVLLAKRAEALARAGLDRVNVSLDSVDYLRFAAITRRDRLADVLAGLAAAHAAGLRPVKVNAVLDPLTGLDDAVSLVRFCLGHDYQLRIIEQMPPDGGASLRPPRTRFWRSCAVSSRWNPTGRRGVRRRPSCGGSPIPRPDAPGRSGSSPRCRTRSARPVTAPG